MGKKRSPGSSRPGLINVAAACADFRSGRRAPVDVGCVVSRLADTAGDLPLAAVAGRQHGLLSTAQLRELGLGLSAIAERCKRGRLHRLHRGVYLVGHGAPTRRGEMLAAVLAARGSVLSHGGALELWGAVEGHSGLPEVIASNYRRPRADLIVHKSSALTPLDLAAIDYIPLTAPARSLLDYAVGADPGALETALNEARANRLLRPSDLVELRARTRGHHGWASLNRLLEGEREPDFSRKEAERRLLGLIRAARLPEPRRNVRLHGYEVDLYWPERGLVVEVDSYAFHSTRRPFERDRRKQDELIDHGLTVLRFTWRQIAYEQVWTIARIATRLAGPG